MSHWLAVVHWSTKTINQYTARMGVKFIIADKTWYRSKHTAVSHHRTDLASDKKWRLIKTINIWI